MHTTTHQFQFFQVETVGMAKMVQELFFVIRQYMNLFLFSYHD